MIRVAFTSLAPFISGAERSLQVTLRHLPAVGVEPAVIGPTTSKLVTWCERQGIPFLSCPLAFRDKWHPIQWWSSVRRMRALLREYRIDLVHSNQMWSYPAVGTAARELGLPRVCHLRDEVESNVLRWCCHATPELAIGISSHIARQAEVAWKDGTGPRIATRINPVELPPRLEPNDDLRLRAGARQSLKIPVDAIVFGFVGQIRAVKGVLGLLHSLSQLPRERPWLALIAGRDNDPGAPYEKLCRERAACPDLVGRVHFLGYLDDLTPFYRAIDVAVVPSLEEPMGRIPLEAASFSRPSLAFSVGGLPDVIQDRKTGWLVPANNWSALTDAMSNVTNGGVSEFGIAAREWVEEVADPVRYAHWLANLYRDLLPTRTSAA